MSWPNLKMVIKDPRELRSVRGQAIRTACENADQEDASNILNFATSWIAKLDQEFADGKQILQDKRLRMEWELLSRLVIDGVPHLSAALPDHGSLFEFLKLVATRPWFNSEAKAKTYGFIAECSVPLATRREAALTIIRDTEMSRFTGVPASILGLLNESTFSDLRVMVRAFDTPKSFNVGAASVLAHYGDVEILPDLEARRPAFLAHHFNSEGNLIHYIWQINIQHPPSQLLEYISSNEQLIQSGLHPWALKRAVALGLPNSEIRQAILNHAGQNTPIPPYGIRPGLESLKKLGLELGVLNANDLPDVLIRPSPWQAAPAWSWRPKPTPPNRRPIRWNPNEANYMPLAEWKLTIDWNVLRPEKAEVLLLQKMCELDLLHPYLCEQLPSGE
ncbi:MAG: hypothetical protein O7F76_12605 [Planctomycetota bacterium]|nr:hypothetical protein [Planctomycetota bacterium]